MIELNLRKGVAYIGQSMSPFSIAQTLLQHRLYAFSNRTIADQYSVGLAHSKKSALGLNKKRPEIQAFGI